ncbi:MAG: UDP-3-O-(3-hydroxymyristoyl)glucosamine N-acyltransferase [Alphaproteobacteria bacterium]
MADPRFYDFNGAVRLDELAALAGAACPEGDPKASLGIDNVAGLSDAEPSHITFLEGARHRNAFAETRAGACFVPLDLDLETRAPKTVRLPVKAPKAAFAVVIARLFTPKGDVTGLSRHHDAVSCDAVLGENVRIGPGAVIGAGAEIGANSVVGPQAVIGPGVTIGRNCVVGAQVTLQFALLGDHVQIHPHTSIGQDGFGYAFDGTAHVKIPQIGRVVIQDHVEIGANTTIDRGAIGDTVIGEGSKIDNLVQVAHNCRIGRGCIVVGQVGLSGSTILEDFVVLGGQVGCAGHLTIGAGSQVAARSGVPKDLPPGGIYGGAPAKPAPEWRREVAFMTRVSKGKIGQVQVQKGPVDEQHSENES